MDIEAIKADREAGTPGPWVSIQSHFGPIDVFDASGRDIVTVYGGGVPSEQKTFNARRIARVPELETAVIALQARVAELEAMLAEEKP